MPFSTRLKILPAMICALSLQVPLVQAATFTVNTTDDTSDNNPGDGLAQDVNGDTSLRAAIEEAEASGGADNIQFDSSLISGGDVSLKLTQYDSGSDSGELGPTALVVNTNITITGPSGDYGITVERSGSTAFRLFHVQSSGDLTLANLTLSKGLAEGGDGGSNGTAGGGGAAGIGGAIVNEGTLTINNSTLSDNQAVGGDGDPGGSSENGGGGGGGVAANGSNNSGNSGGAGGGPGGGAGGTSGSKNGNSGSQVGGGGGGGWGDDWCACTQTGGNGGNGNDFGGGGGAGSIVATGGGQSAYGGDGGDGGFGGGGGGGGGADSGAASEVAGSGGNGGFGAGDGANGTSGDSARSGAGGGGAGLGGALFNNGGTAVLNNTTLSGNSASGGGSGNSNDGLGDGGAGSGYGGAIFNWDGDVTLRHVTVADTTVTAGDTNGSAGSSDGAVYNRGDSTTAYLTIYNSILADTTGGDDYAESGTSSESGAGVLIETGSGSFGGALVTSLDPALSALADNRGPTYTHAIGSGSPALDTGSNGYIGGLTTDQRGGIFDRIADGDLNGSAQADIGAYEHVLIDYGDAPDFVTGTGDASVLLATGSDDFRISSMGSDGSSSYGASNPRIVYNTTDNEYFVVWQGDDNTGSLVDNEFEIFGQRINASTGALLGSRIRISVMASDGDANYDAYRPAVAWNSTTNKYLVVWYGDDNSGALADNEYEVYGRLVDADGSLGTQTRLTTIGTDGETTYGPSNPDVAYSTTSNEFLLVWQGDDPSSSDNKFEIYGQRVSSTGSLSGSSFLIGSMSGDANYDAYSPSVAWNSTNNQYMVVWHGDNNSGSLVDNENEIWGQRVSSGGGLSGSMIRISTMGTDGQTNARATNARLAYNNIYNEFLVVWYGEEPVAPLVDNEYEIFGQLITASTGALNGSRLQISDTGEAGNTSQLASNPTVAFNGSTGNYMVAWQADHILDNKFDIFGRRVYQGGGLMDSTDLALSEMGASSEDGDYDAGDAAVAFGATNGYFMLAWRSDDSSGSLVDGENEVWGQLLEDADIVDYKTRGAEDGPNHRLVANLKIGSAVDSESDGQPSLESDGDDSAGSTPDDEDGLSSTAFTTVASVDVTVTNNSGSSATLYGWIDYDGDGLFENASERASTTVNNGTTNGVVTLNFPVAPSGFAANTQARFRLSTDSAAADSTGLADDGEVEDYAVTLSKASTTTSINSTSPNPSVVGNNYTVNVSVSATSGTPSGSVTVSDGTDNCVASLTSGSGSCTINPGTDGSKTLTATYGGDDIYLGSVSSSYSHTVTATSGSCQSGAVVVGSKTYPAGDSVVKSETSIATSGTVSVPSSASVIYLAPSITLNPNFTAVSGSEFNAISQSISCP